MATLRLGRIRVTPSISLHCLWVLVAVPPKHDPSGPPWYFQRYVKLHPWVEKMMSFIKKLLDNRKKPLYNKAISRVPYIGTNRSYDLNEKVYGIKLSELVMKPEKESTVVEAEKPAVSEGTKEVVSKPLLCEILKREGPPSDRDLAKMHLVMDVSKYLSVSLKEATKVVEDMENFYSINSEA